jgi:DNA-directed RNA polymerase specialized sigma24 family protein
MATKSLVWLLQIAQHSASAVAFGTVFRRLAEGQFQLRDWDGLQALLTCVTLRRCGKWLDYFGGQRRDVTREVGLAAGSDSSASGLDVLDREPTPVEAAMMAETLERLLAGLNELERAVVALLLQGEAAADISRQLGCSESKVRRVRAYVRERLQRWYAADGSNPGDPS